MRHIPLEDHAPSAAWLKKSDELTQQLIELHEKGDIEGRNKIIKDSAAHWGALKDWLFGLSHQKCWFSETRNVYNHNDVEHFRPKLEAKNQDGTQRDGYWWLAFDYMNYRACGNVGNRKKGGWFPLCDGSAVSTFALQCEETEVPYLLDPIDADDVALLAFDEKGDAIPVPGISEWEQCRVAVTVERLKLNEHEPLTQARLEVWQLVSRTIERYLTASAKAGGGKNPGAKRDAKRYAEKIRAMSRDDAELSSVAKWCVLFRDIPRLKRLIA